jgi:hypothetical protein
MSPIRPFWLRTLSFLDFRFAVAPAQASADARLGYSGHASTNPRRIA